MNTAPDYIEKNRKSWNQRTEVHVESEFYDIPGFLSGKSSLKEIELHMLGDVKGKTILHLQCHFGQDSLSLARMGAKVTGADLSDKAIEKAKELNTQMGLDADFICCDIYDLPKHLDKQFDIVFTTYGTIGWLPDLDKWAGIISHYLKPGGQFIFVDFHPVLWMFDDAVEKVGYNYFNDGPIEETQDGTYADKSAPMKIEYVGWNHSISEVVNNLIKNGLEIDSLEEFDYSPYNIFANPVEVERGKFRVAHHGNRIPLVYSIMAHKHQ
ncbi:class I SAM-dependent methyltransferase [Polluticoccus soli]|uniref:class I SAM-dependent methyltransferase n=1 Tax=Polluticoccus soli TaxID=3034150 RepID=UPI0023E2D2B5|nr:class I SAM-dependent methyltransferase [Flavipsychrobacter sp. JY13-12]